jgi:hypothetical protein
VNRNHVIVGLALLFVLARFAAAALYQTDSQNVATPSTNGTADQLNITSRMQQYVGFYGGITTEIRKNSTAGSGSMYSKSVTAGKIYAIPNGQTPTGALIQAKNDSFADGNLSLSGYYVTGNHFLLNSTVCGLTGVDNLLTTDNYAIGLLRDSAGPTNYLFCTDILPKTSAVNLGEVSYEFILPSTKSAWDFYVDLG